MRSPFVPAFAILFIGGTSLAVGAAGQSQSAQAATAQPAASPDKPKDTQTQPQASPKKTYTNDDLASGTPPGRATPQKPSTNNGTKKDLRDEAWWHNRAQNLRNQTADVDRQIAQIKDNPHNSPTAGGGQDTVTGSNPIYYGGQYGRLKNLQARKATLEKQMEDLEEEARRAGVPSGWLR